MGLRQSSMDRPLPVLSSTLDGVPYADADYGYGLKGRYASYGSSSNSYTHNVYPQSAYSETPNQSYAPQYPSYGGPSLQSKKTFDIFQSLDQVADALARAGLESPNLLDGIDFTNSKEWRGCRSQNPYEQEISIIGRTLLAFDELGADSGFGPHRLHDIGGISALPGDAGFDLELGHPLDDIGEIRAHLLRAERHAYYNQELLSYKQWRAYIEDRKIVNSGARDSMLIQPIITLLGEAFGGALAYALNSSSETSQINTLVRVGILIGVGITVAGIGMRRFKCRFSDYMMKTGALGIALAIILAFASLLPPWLTWSVGAATSVLVASGLAMI